MKVVFPTRLLAPRYRDIDAKDVRFRDYDGAIVASMTVPEARALEALPALPSHPGLVCQGWNWSLDELHNLTHPADVGAHFITDDGKTRLYMVIPAGDTNPVPLEISYNGKLHVDWGDGSEPFVEEPEWELEEDELYPTWQLSHTYPVSDKDAQYVITVWSEGGSVRFGQSDWDWGNYNIFGEFDLQKRESYRRLKAVEFGNITGSYRKMLFYFCDGIQTVTMPNNVTEFEAAVFSSCESLRHVTLPAGIDTIQGSTFSTNKGLVAVSIPNGVVHLGGDVFLGCTSLTRLCLGDTVDFIGITPFQNIGVGYLRLPPGPKSLQKDCFLYAKNLSHVSLPRGITTMGDYCFYGCESLAEVDIPEGVSMIPVYCFTGCKLLQRVNFPSTVTEIRGAAFRTDAKSPMLVLDFRAARQVPTLSDTDGENRVTKVIVPDALYDDWKEANNWKSYGSKIVKASEA